MANNGWVYDEIDGGSKQEFDHPGEIVLRRAMAVHCLHTTEGTSWPGYKGGASAPHFTIDPIKRQTRQHLPITEGARALRYRGRQTNTMGVAQYEIIGRASQMQDLPQSGIEYIAHVLGVVGKHTEIPAKSSVTFYPVGDAYGTHAKSRLPYAAFAQYRGILGHQHVPDNCVVADTLILKGDLTWARAGDLKTGDVLVGFDEETEKIGNAHGGRRFAEALALVHGRSMKDCYEVTMEDGTIVTASEDHPWLVNLPYVNRGSRVQWVKTRDLDATKHRIKSLGVKPWSARDDSQSGYIAGSIDCDGSISLGRGNGDFSIQFGQAAENVDVLDAFVLALAECGRMVRVSTRTKVGGGSFGTSEGFSDVRVLGGLWSGLALLAETGPRKFERIRNTAWQGRVVGKTTTTLGISSIARVGEREVVNLETSARTYIAAGMLCHNSHWDPGEFPIDKLVEAMTGETAPVKPATEPHPTHPAKRSMVKVDGYWGENFTGALEEDFGHTVTGVVSSQSEYWEDDNPGLTSGWDWVRRGVVRGSRVFRKVQIWAGMPEDEQDGVGGPDSFGALQRKLRDLGYYTGPIDGEIWTESPTIKDFQRAHNDGKVK